jgi:xanthine/CO dehydrogenase XdhC/CoxF family maturation factor
MKHWAESSQVYAAIAALHRREIPAALATVVRVRGSAYRHEGAKLLVGADGTIVGNVSGGCLEQDVREVARRVLATGAAERRQYCSGSDEIAAWDLGVGCEGTVELYIAPVMDDHGAERAAIAREAPFVVELPLGPAGAGRVVRNGPGTTGLSTSGDGQEVFVDAFIPPPRLLVCGAGDDAIPLARLGVTTGFRVVVTDRRPGLLTPERFGDDVTLLLAHPRDLATTSPPTDDTFAVVMTHHFADDSSYLGVLRATPAAYIGMLGPRQRTERMLAAGPGIAQGLDGRIHAPAGLDIGTDGAEQVALSIIAEIMAVHAGRPARPLRERRVPIHGRDD